jgi:hypothetical protein
MGVLQLRLRDTTQKTEVAKLKAERDENAKALANMQRRQVQFQHEIRRKEHDYDRLQQRLRDMLTEKVRVPQHVFSGQPCGLPLYTSELFSVVHMPMKVSNSRYSLPIRFDVIEPPVNLVPGISIYSCFPCFVLLLPSWFFACQTEAGGEGMPGGCWQDVGKHAHRPDVCAQERR